MSERILNIPNALSFYRLAAAPVILILIFAGQREAFSVLVVISLITDALDGFIARVFGQTTTLGARLDSRADELTLGVAVVGAFVFERTSFWPDLPWLYLWLVCFVLSRLVPYLRFGRFPALHLYSSRISGYLLAVNFVLLFTIGYQREFFVFAFVFASLACLEIVAISLLQKEFKADQKGIYWVLRDMNRKAA